MIALFLSLPIVIGSYLRDESVTGYLPAAGPWLLEEVDGAPAAGIALHFVPGGLRAEGDCLRLTAEQTAPYPWFEATGIEAETAGCPPDEAAFADALGRVIVAEVLGEVLILSDPGTIEPGTIEMVFRLAPSQP